MSNVITVGTRKEKDEMEIRFELQKDGSLLAGFNAPGWLGNPSQEEQTALDTPEQEARNILERLGIEDAQRFTSGDLVEIANLIAESRRRNE